MGYRNYKIDLPWYGTVNGHQLSGPSSRIVWLQERLDDINTILRTEGWISLLDALIIIGVADEEVELAFIALSDEYIDYDFEVIGWKWDPDAGHCPVIDVGNLFDIKDSAKVEWINGVTEMIWLEFKCNYILDVNEVHMA